MYECCACTYTSCTSYVPGTRRGQRGHVTLSSCRSLDFFPSSSALFPLGLKVCQGIRGTPAVWGEPIFLWLSQDSIQTPLLRCLERTLRKPIKSFYVKLKTQISEISMSPSFKTTDTGTFSYKPVRETADLGLEGEALLSLRC